MLEVVLNGIKVTAVCNLQLLENKTTFQDATGATVDYALSRGLTFDPTVGFTLPASSVADMGTYECEFVRGTAVDKYIISVMVMRKSEKIFS